MKKNMNVKQLTFMGLMTALVLVGTMIVQIPTPTKGYIHIGDTMVYLSAILLGPIGGSLAAAVGSMFADIFSGYSIYAPATFVIKGLDAFAVALIYQSIVGKDCSFSKKIISFIMSTLVGAIVMVVGYLGYETILYGFATALVGVISNVTQSVAGIALAFPMMLALEKTKVLRKIHECKDSKSSFE